MGGPARKVLHQSFLPARGQARALVWKYSPVNWGRRPRHFHVEPELNLIVTGSALFGIGETVVKACAGELLGFPPGQDHVLLEASPDLYLYAIGMDPNFSSEVLRGDPHSVAAPLHLRLASNDFKALATRSAAIVDQGGVDQPGAELWQQAHWLGQRSVARLSGGMHVITRRVLAMLSKAPELGLAVLAKQVRANPSEISRYFHRDLSMTLVEYRTRLRLLRFIHRVDAGTDNLLAAAEAAGFGSYSQCHRIFQSQLGCAPRHFFVSGGRQQMQQAYDP